MVTCGLANVAASTKPFIRSGLRMSIFVSGCTTEGIGFCTCRQRQRCTRGGIRSSKLRVDSSAVLVW